MPAKPLALRYRRRLWQTLRTVEAVAAGKVKGAEWDQWTYGTKTPCGTAHCFAGWAAENAKQVHQGRPDLVKNEDHICTWALTYLGLPEDSGGLFACGNTLDDLRRLVREFAGPEPKAGRR